MARKKIDNTIEAVDTATEDAAITSAIYTVIDTIDACINNKKIQAKPGDQIELSKTEYSVLKHRVN